MVAQIRLVALIDQKETGILENVKMTREGRRRGEKNSRALVLFRPREQTTRDSRLEKAQHVEGLLGDMEGARDHDDVVTPFDARERGQQENDGFAPRHRQ
jgi:hypothetical protein